MAKQTTTRKRYDDKKRYRITLSAPAPVGRRNLLPGDRHTVTGKIANQIADMIDNAVEL